MSCIIDVEAASFFMKTFFRNYWPVLVLLGVEFVIAATNYRPGTYLMGWDNVMPEFNFRQAFITNIFGVWQEHRGLGLPDGMGHAANLVHTITLWIMSLVLPQNILRYTFQFLMHFFGMVGAMRVIREIRGEEKNNNSLALIGGLFYGLNLITIQMFYTPLEAFSVHFAALPWLAYSLLHYLHTPSRNSLLLFICVSILSTPQFFIPTLLLPTAILLGCVSIGAPLRRIAVAALTFLCINAFWFIPYLYNLPYNAPIIQQAKINQMSSNEVYEQNRAFGDLPHVLSMQGFMLDFEDVNADGQPIHVMDTWRTWVNQPVVRAMSVVFAIVILAGLCTRGFRLVWIIALFFLANNTPLISDAMSVLRDRLPLFAEAYRFPFTKFSLLFAFASTILFIHGISFVRPRLLKLSFIMLFFIASFPVFQGNFFYDALRVNLPRDYSALFAFMNTRDHAGRTAYLPQPSYWSWKHYNFGYVGSGFLWYGLPQPLMDRAFDPWSHYNEQYYWELSRALYGKNAENLEHVFEKYDIRYIILDGNLRAPGHDRALFTEEITELLATLPDTKPLGMAGALTVYERNTTSNSFIQTAERLPMSVPLTDNPISPQEIISNTEPIFSTELVEVLTPEAVKPCGVLRTGTTYGEVTQDNSLRLTATDQRGCISFGDSSLPHSQGYVVKVQTRHISGRPLMFAIINNTAKHIEQEAYLTGTDYFILPPLAPDGLGYSVYFSNDAIGDNQTINEIKQVAFYPFAYPEEPPKETVKYTDPTYVRHPNPSFYEITATDNAHAVILSQAYNPNWLAWSNGTFLSRHTLVDTWKNGWDRPSNEVTNNESTILLIFWPQLLQYLGGLLIVLPLYLAWRTKT